MSPTLRKLCPACRTTLITAPTRRCPACTRAVEQKRGTAAQRGYGTHHRAWRRVILATYPTCADCGADGQPDDHADHVLPLAAGGDWSIENGRRRCPRCHARKTVLHDGGLGKPRTHPGGRPISGQAGPPDPSPEKSQRMWAPHRRHEEAPGG
jgi:5-methylcytosine-specific restriction protein A